MPNNIPLKHNNKYIKEKRVFIVGNSHIECAINDSLLPAHYLNIAKSGEPLFYTTSKAQRIIHSNKVDTVIIEFDNTSLTSIAWVLDNDRLLQNFKENFFLMTWEQFEFLFQNNPQKTVKSLLVLNFSNFIHINNIEGGYLYLDRNRLGKTNEKRGGNKDSYPTKYSDTLQLKNFESLSNLISNNSPVHFVITRMPIHKGILLTNDTSYFKLVNKLLAFKNTSYIDFHKNVNLSDTCFADSTHLNYKGAKLFTPLFGKALGLGKH